MKKITLKDLKALVGDSVIMAFGTVWISLGIATGFIFVTLLIPKVESMVGTRTGLEAWFIAFIPVYALLNVLAIGAYLYHRFTRRFTPRVFQPVKGKIEMEKEGGAKRKWYQQWLS